MAAEFVHLRVHTEYSLLDSVVRVPQLIAAVAAAGMPAVAVTDQSNLFAMVKFYRAALERGVQPVVGVDLLVRASGEHQPPSRLSLLCQSQDGYRNVTRLVSRAYLEGQQRGVPMIAREWLTPQTLAGLIGLSCAAEGDVGRALVNGREHEARAALAQWQRLLPERYYLELQRLGRPGEEAYISAALELAARRGVPVVATNDVRFLRREDFAVHEARVCIQEGRPLADATRPRRYTPEQFLRTGAQMAERFADIPEALANAVEIARRTALVLELGRPRLPAYPVPGEGSAEDFLRAQAAAGLERRLAENGLTDASAVRPQDSLGAGARAADLAQRAAGDWPAGAPGHGGSAAYRTRLQSELEVICQMGFAGYFLIVADFIRWAREHGVPVGPGRGSGAGSLVAYSLEITDLDPLRYDLLFERFLNPERVSMPDFDVDFCMEGRDRVIEYVAQRYGRERVSQIITYGTMAAKAVVRDAGRVLGMSYGYVDRIAKLIPFELGITLDDALEKEPELKQLYEREDEVRGLIDLARSLEGLIRNAGMHAGGVVIAPSVLTDFAPLYCDAEGGSVVTQFDKDDVEAAGLVKFDFLGLRTLTIIDWAVKSINALRAESGEAPLEISKIPLDDPLTYDQVLKQARTVAVFQFESSGMQRLLKDAKPDRFEDLIALGALFRPGPMELIPEYVACKHGKQPQYLHPDMKEVLGVTYGVFVYQEQVMQIAQRLAGYTLGGADLLRRAMGKKKPEEMAKQRAVFVAGAAARGIGAPVANAIFDQMEKFAGYGFNKSHAAAYALLSYQTAYLKAHYPAQFMAAMLSADMDHTDKVVILIRECAEMDLTVLPPDVNTSLYPFTAEGRAIRYGLGAIRGVGRGAAETLIAEREAHGPFASLEDLCRRLDLQKLNRRVLEALLRSGSLDALGASRAALMERLPAAMQLGEQNSKASRAGQDDLFGLAGAQPQPPAAPPSAAAVPEWPQSKRLAGERETLGLYLTGHPIAALEAGLAHVVSHRIGALLADRPAGALEGGRVRGARTVSVAGLVDAVRKRAARVIVTLDDATGRLEASLFEEQYQTYRELIVKDALVLAEGQLRFDEFADAWRLTVHKLSDLTTACEQQARRIVLRWPAHADVAALQDQLAQLLERFRPGTCPIVIEYSGSLARGALRLGPQWSVQPSAQLIAALEALLGAEAITVRYGASPQGPQRSADGR